MRTTRVLGCVLLVAGVCAGCVERKLLIRSDPPGAPVWVDERRVGTTPLELHFSHYGQRRIRVGPMRDESGRLEYRAEERVIDVRAPWYEQFPLDFFAEVLWPATLKDAHKVELKLSPASGQPQLYGPQRAEQVREQAEQFRNRALSPVPELEQ